jgi:tetrahydromethanopterin S-methyltransferase subunit A
VKNERNETERGGKDPDIADVPVIQAEEPEKLELDSAGYFVIVPLPDRMSILARHYSYDKELLRIVEGRDARSVYRMLIKYGWVSTLNHAAYLGQELARAEIAMKAGFDYVQG